MAIVLKNSKLLGSLFCGSILAYSLLADENITKNGVQSKDDNLTIKDTANIPTLRQINVRAKQESVGVSTIDRPMMNSLTNGNGDVATMLKVLPNVQFDYSKYGNAKQGEISPSEVSINGMKFYDNKFVFDGMNVNNNIDPAADNPMNNATPSSSSQSFAIDTSLIDKVTVYDSNVPVEFGGFSGGVISMEAKKPTRDFGGGMAVEHTRSQWMHYYLSDSQETSYENSTSYTSQPEFSKYTYRLWLEARPTDKLGVIGSFSRKTSQIPLKSYTGGASSLSDESEKIQTRQNDNFFIKAYYDFSPEVEADLALLGAPGVGEYFIANAKNSNFKILSGGKGINGGLKYKGNGFVVDQRLSYNDTQSSRSADGNVWKLWRWSSDKNWGRNTGATATSGEGGYGDVEQKQSVINYKAKVDFDPIKFAGTEHSLQLGVELEKQEQYYNRKTQYEQYTVATALTAGATCVDNFGNIDTEFCSTTPANGMPNGQYLKQRIIHKAGKFTVKENTKSLFLQDEIKLERAKLRLGARYDSSDLSAEHTISPRAVLTVDVFNNGDTTLEGGIGRYHSRNFMVYYNQAERNKLITTAQNRTLVAGVLQQWPDNNANSTTWKYVFNDLKMPYSDEGMIGLSQKVASTLWKLKFVDRNGHDEVVSHSYKVGTQSTREYKNIGSSTSQTYSLSVENTRPFELVDTKTTFLAAIDKTETKTSHATYDDGLSDVSASKDSERIVKYDGAYIRWVDRPADNFARPWNAKIAAITMFPSARLMLGNMLNYRGGYSAMVAAGSVVYNGSTIDNYEKKTIKPAVTWDCTITYTLPIKKEHEAYAKLSIENVLDKKNMMENDGSEAVYEKGRQFFVELGYKF
ncbi:MAG: TonB-dependent receptor plug domain-containing protein [Campylobacterales bacterium]